MTSRYQSLGHDIGLRVVQSVYVGNLRWICLPVFFFFCFFFSKAANIVLLMILLLPRRLRRFGSLLWYLVSVGKGMGIFSWCLQEWVEPGLKTVQWLGCHSLLGQSVPVWYGPGEERHLSVLCPAGWDVVAAGIVLFGAQSASCTHSVWVRSPASSSFLECPQSCWWLFWHFRWCSQSSHFSSDHKS